MSRVLVTGGAGYVGSILVPQLVAEGHQVTVLEKFYFGKQVLGDLVRKKKIIVWEMDTRELSKSGKSLKGFDAVIHLAALSNDPSCELSPDLTEDVNVGGSHQLADLAKQGGVKRFFFASSCSVYGFGEGQILTEDSPKNPVSAYAESKIKAEEYFFSIADEKFQPTAFRFATVYGLAPRMRFDLAINLMTMNGVTKKKIFIMGGGKQWRPFIHVRDVARVYLQALKEPLSKIGGKVFNVGSDEQNYQIADLAKMVAAELKGVELEWTPDDPDKRTYHVSFEKIKEELGFTPKYDAKFAIREISKALEDGTIPDISDDRYYNIRTLKSFVIQPVVAGGEPVRKRFLPFALPSLGVEEEKEVIETLRSGWITTGPRTKKFEEKLAAYVGAKHCLAVDSCTSALHLSLAVLDIGPGDEVIVPPVTFAATANVVEHTGAKPVFVDVDPKTLNLDVKKLAKAVTSKTKAIIAVHMSGYPCDLKEIHALAKKKKIRVIEDAAHAIGSTYGKAMIGSLSDFTCFSFYPIKNMTAIEGGAITTNEGKWVDRLRRLTLHGLDKDAWKRYTSEGKPQTYVMEPGFKYNMTDVQAAVGLHQLDKLDGFNRRRAHIAQQYDQAFHGLLGFSRPDYGSKDRQTNHHLYIVLLRLEELTCDRDSMLEALKKEGIGTGIHFIPMHLHPFYKKKYGLKESQLPVASDLADRIFSLPLYPGMSDSDVQDVIKAFQKLLKHFAKKR
ncbi:MAG TPA: aminotransferase class I/II-fold pyridoxal phosphate-dependent enzyme [bacterium]|nr:aminotransferase class I/II-fold pyridoxal phosphate-dependent enzyme [bacterium]